MSELPPLPAGYALDAPPPLPPGYKLDAAPAEPAPVSTNDAVRALARGVPATGWMNQLEAGTNAALAPVLNPLFAEKDQLKGDFAARKAASLAQQEGMDAAMQQNHPIINTGLELAGGAASIGGAAKTIPGAAKALGMVGPARTAIPAGIASGAGIGAVDALTHGEDPVTGAEVGGLTGGGGVLAGKVAGKVWDAARGMFRDAGPAVPTRTMPVNGVEVPVRESVVTKSPLASQEEEGIRKGARGDIAQQEAQAHDAAHDAAMGQVHDNLAASLDPTGAAPSSSPMAAGEAVGSEVASQEAARAAAEAQRVQGVGNETAAIRGALNTSPTPGVLADSPRTAAQFISESLQRARDTLAGARDRAYEALRSTPGEFNPAGFSRISNNIRNRLSTGADPVKISDQLTPHAAEALRDIETNVGQRRFENQTETPMQIGPDGRPMDRPITADTIDEARKRLISMQRAANDAARRTGDFTDTRAMRRIISEFDDHVARVAQTPGGFSGDANELQARMSRARGLHSELKRTFGPTNPQDVAGKAMEKIVGKRGVEPIEHGDVMSTLFGGDAAGGGKQAKAAQRVIDIFGENSPQHVALKQGLLSHLVDATPGTAALTHEAAADRIHRFFTGGKGVDLAQTVFSPSERARLLAHANRMRTAIDPLGSAPSGKATPVEQIISKWSGRANGMPASPKTIIDDLMGSTGTKGIAAPLAEHLKRTLSPASLGKLKQGVWDRISQAEGAIPWKDQKTGERITKFLDGDGKGLADALFTDQERQAMRNLAEAHIANLPVEGTTNPSGSGHVAQRLARGAVHGILPFIGLHAGGLPGVAVALAGHGAVKNVADRAAGAAARTRFYGPQAKAPASTMPQIFGALGGPLISSQQRNP